MDIDLLFARIEKLPSLLGAISAKEAKALTELDELWRAIGNAQLKLNCGNCRIRAYHEITSFTYQKLKEMLSKKYVLKENQVVYFDHTHYTKSTITDEVAEAMLKSNPVNAELFETLPDGALEDAKPKKKGKKAADEVDAADETEQTDEVAE